MPQIVFYHIQKDPGDDSLHPEAFMISKYLAVLRLAICL